MSPSETPPVPLTFSKNISSSPKAATHPPSGSPLFSMNITNLQPSAKKNFTSSPKSFSIRLSCNFLSLNKHLQPEKATKNSSNNSLSESRNAKITSASTTKLMYSWWAGSTKPKSNFTQETESNASSWWISRTFKTTSNKCPLPK
jgi:hypothetical protein